VTPEHQKEFLVRAQHEAAHAVAAHVLGFRIKTLNITRTAKYDGTFAVENVGDDGPIDWANEDHRKLVSDYDVVVAAGEYGVIDKNGVSTRERAEDDAKVLSDHAAQMFSEPGLQEAYKAKVKAQAQDLVNSTPHREAIETLVLNFYPSNGVIDAGNAHKIIEAVLAKYPEPEGSI
jgi:hypothetical protein